MGDGVADFEPSTESLADEIEQDELVPDGLSQIPSRLSEGKTIIDGLIKGVDASWRVVNDRWIQRPTTSRIPHETVHPAFLRTARDDVTGLDGFARTITSDATERSARMDFDADYRKVCDNLNFHRAWADLMNLPDDAPETSVQSRLQQVIYMISQALGIYVTVKYSERMAVGGILAHNEYDIHGRTDLTVYNSDGDCLLVIEVKTRQTFSYDRWYRDFRATQILTAIYYFNAPIFLATDCEFKVFYENASRDAIYTYPTFAGTAYAQPTTFLNTLRTGAMDATFIKAVIICLRAKPSIAKPVLLKPTNGISEIELPKRAFDTPYVTSSEKTRREVTQPTLEYANEKGHIESINIRLYSEEDMKVFDNPPQSC